MSQRSLLLATRSRAFRAALHACERFATIDEPIVLLGERGTGKTRLARYIHERSGRAGGFVYEAVTNIPVQLEDDSLSGHNRGAFTGAHVARMGFVESARNGTLFLDEIGDASPKLQAALLKFLDGSPIRRLGDLRETPVGCRFILATNKDLKALVIDGSFRQDLLDRFGYFRITVPPLRERREDILPLAAHFLAQMKPADRHEPLALSRAVEQLFTEAPWHGNVRELESVCRFAAVIAHQRPCIELDHLPPDFVAGLGATVRSRYDHRENRRAHRAVEAAGGNKSAASRSLGISRTQIYRLLKLEAAAM